MTYQVTKRRGVAGTRVGLAGAALLAAGLGASRPARAADTNVAPGGSLTLSADLVLADTDSFNAGGGGDRCQIDGQGHGISTMPAWKGTLRIVGCDLVNMGTDTVSAIAIDVGAGATFDVENSSFGASGQITLALFADATILFNGNTLGADSLVPIVKGSVGDSQPAFSSNGPGGASQKLFQGNRVLRSWVQIADANNWLIGGSTPVEENVLVGVRGGLDVHGLGMVVRGNYFSANGELAGWNQVATFNGGSDDDSMIVEHNIMRGGNWLIRSIDGAELRYNLLVDPYTIAWVLTGSNSNARIHHNVMVRNNKQMETFYRVAGISVIYMATDPSTTIFNNTMDASGYCYDTMGRAVSIDDGGFVQSLRNNVIYQFPGDMGPTNTALVGPGQMTLPSSQTLPVMKGDPGPVQLGYADYNLFDNPDAVTKDNYGNSVANATERVSPGFALHDVTVGGPKDEQVEPKFTGPLPKVYPFSDDDLIAGTVSVCQILAFYRQIYTPAAGSPLIDAGDPADGVGTDIGAIGAGMADPNDQFGTLCSAADSALPSPPKIVTTCPSPITTVTGGGTPPPPGFICVCSEGTAAPSPLALLAVLLLAGLAGVARPATGRSGRTGRRGGRSPLPPPRCPCSASPRYHRPGSPHR